MVKSRSEIQRAYRQRLKERNNEQYLTKERERRRRTYVANQHLSEKERCERNRKNREYLRIYRQRKRERVQNMVLNENQTESLDTSGYDSGNIESQQRLQVRLNFTNRGRANGPRMRVSKELKKVKQEMKMLKSNYDTLKRKHKSTMRNMQRMKRKAEGHANTPKSKTAKFMENLNFNPQQRKAVQKELVFSNAICDEIRAATNKAPVKSKKVVQNVIAGNLIRKYRLVRKVALKTGMCRNKLSKIRSKSINIQSLGRRRVVATTRNKVIEFLERDENSRNMPGKADCIKAKSGEICQTRVLTDYLSNLYAKFMSENPSMKLSFTSFTRIRPTRIRLTSMITRDTCLCTRHQNMSLTLKALKMQDIECTLNGEKMLERKKELIQEAEQKLSANDITVGQWKRVEIESKGQKKSVMKIVDKPMPKPEFLAHLQEQMQSFDEHVSRIKTQYAEMKNLKNNLAENDCIIHMDFSENYSCKSVQEIQSAYWNQSGVTLHPVVVYFKRDESAEIQHQSYVFISDEMGHNASTVLAFLDKLIPEVKALKPNLKCIHYWTDSPTSQYRNKVIFNMVANHDSMYGIRAVWNYWEAGHGKGPCDGLGGRVKRMADEAVNAGKVCIQDPSGFYAWSQSSHCTMKNVRFIFVSSETCESKGRENNDLHLKPVVGTMKIHAVVGKGNSQVAVRNTSCYCETCVSDSLSTCATWREESLLPKQRKPTRFTTISERAETISPENNTESESNAIDAHDTYCVDDYIAACYLGRWYIGRILNVDAEDDTVEVTFLQQRKNMFQWPSRPDVIWVDSTDILCKVAVPAASGKSSRMLVFKSSDLEKIEQNFGLLQAGN